MKQRFWDFIKLAVGWPLSIIALFFIAKIFLFQSNVILRTLSSLNYFLLLWSIICFLLYFSLRGYLWNFILEQYGYHIPLKEALYAWGYSEVKRFIPGNIWSFLSRTVLFTEKNVSSSIIFSSLFIEAQLTVIGALVVSLLASSFLIYSIFSNPLIYTLFFLITVVTVFLLTGIYILTPFFSRRFQKRIKYFLPHFSIFANIQLVLLAIGTYFLFGLGSYLAITSVVALTPLFVLTFIGIFAFSLLGGYASLITPMGLGVREAIMTASLSKFITLQAASFASIFARIIFIISELCFLLLITVWCKTRYRIIAKIERAISHNPREAILLFFIAAYISYFSATSFIRHDNFYSGRFDLGNMVQTVWNTSRGRIFQLTDPNGTEIVSRLSYHADFFLILLAPLYKIWPDPKMLLLLQAVCMGLGAFFIYIIAFHILKEKTISLIFSFLFLMYPSLQYAVLYDFHSVTLSTTLLLGAYYFLMKKRYFWFFLFSLLAALTKEEVWMIIGLFGLRIFLSTHIGFKQTKRSLILKEGLFGIALFLVFSYVFYLLIAYAIPQTKGSPSHFALSYYSDFGETPGNIIKNILAHPQKTFQIIFANGKINYLHELFQPLGFLPLFSPFALIFALPDLTINLLSNNSQLHQIYYQYTATIVPFLFIAAMHSIGNLNRFLPQKTQSAYGVFLILIMIYSAYFFGPLPGSINPNIDMYTHPQEKKDLIEKTFSKIPRKYFVAATNNMGAHLSQRQKITTIPIGLDKADYIAFLLDDPFAQPSLQAQKQMVQKLKLDKKYIVLIESGDFIVFQKMQ